MCSDPRVAPEHPRRPRWWTVAAVVAALAVTACERKQQSPWTAQATDKPPPWASRTTSGAGFPCEVDRVLADSCRRCHWEPLESDVPFTFHTWEDIQRPMQGKPVHVLMKSQVEARMMPPTDLPANPKVQPLTEHQRSVLLTWLNEGAPRSTETCR